MLHFDINNIFTDFNINHVQLSLVSSQHVQNYLRNSHKLDILVLQNSKKRMKKIYRFYVEFYTPQGSRLSFYLTSYTIAILSIFKVKNTMIRIFLFYSILHGPLI